MKYVIEEGVAGGFDLCGAALDLWRYRGSEVIISGPAETGKTLACCWKLDQLLWTFPKSQAVMVRKVRDTIYSTVLQTYTRKVLTEGDGVTAYGGERPSWFDYPNGSRLWLAGMDDAGKALSSERDFVYVNQAEELSLTDWETLTTRTTGRAGNAPYGQCLGDCNPSYPHHWIKQRTTLKLLESRHEDNPTLWDGQGWTDQGRRTLAVLDALTGVRKDRYRYGRWVSAEGVVYSFDARIHVVPRSAVPPPAQTFASVDWGLKNPGTLQVWSVDGDGRMYLVSEVYRTGQLIDWWVERGKQARANYGVQCFVCDPSEPAYIEAFQRAGLWAVGADNAIRPGIDAVAARLVVQPDGRPRLMLVEDALTTRDEVLANLRKPVCLAQEFDSYVWPKASDGRPVKEVPVKENDHGCDACRYAVMWQETRHGVNPGDLHSGGGKRGGILGGSAAALGKVDVRKPPRGVF